MFYFFLDKYSSKTFAENRQQNTFEEISIHNNSSFSQLPNWWIILQHDKYTCEEVALALPTRWSIFMIGDKQTSYYRFFLHFNAQLNCYCVLVLSAICDCC